MTMPALLAVNECRQASEDHEHSNVLGARDDGRSSRFAFRLSRIEPSSCGGGVCTTVQLALNAHLVLLGDCISSMAETTIAGTTRTNRSRYLSRINPGEENDDDDDMDESTTSLLHWFYYDEPETPIHPALEYETGHLLSSAPRQIENKFDNDETDIIDGPLQVINQTDYSSHVNNVHHEQNNEYGRVKVERRNYVHSFISNDVKLIISLLFLTMIASFSMITAKFQSIPMYNYPIFLILLHSLLAVPVTGMLSYLFEIPEEKKIPEKPNRDANIATRTAQCLDSIQGVYNQRKVSTNNATILSRLVVVGLLDAIASTLQILATTYLPGSILVLLPPMSSTALLYTLSLLRTKKYRKVHPILPLCCTSKRKRSRAGPRRRLMKATILFTIGLFFVLIGGIVFVFIPVLTSKNAPEYYCESIDDKANERSMKHAHAASIDDNTCIICRQERTAEHCLNQNRTKKHKNKHDPNITSHFSSQVTEHFYLMSNIERVMQEQVRYNIQNGTADIEKWGKVDQETDDNEQLCRWIPFHESSKEDELTMIFWSTILVLSTIPMVLSALLKQKIARVASSIRASQKILNANVNRNDVSADVSNNNIQHHQDENFESVNFPNLNGSRINLNSNYSIRGDGRLTTNGCESHPLVEDLSSGQPQQQLLHPTLQFILNNPRYWTVCMSAIQFFFCILLAVPAYNLVAEASSVESKSSSFLRPNHPSLWNFTSEVLVESGAMATTDFLSTNSNVILRNLWDGWLCYSAGVDTITTGCHPDTNMCSSYLAFWSVNLHVICTFLYRTCLLLVFKFMITTNSRRLHIPVRNASGANAPNINSVKVENDRFPTIRNETADRGVASLLTNESEQVDGVHPTISFLKNNLHRLLFFSLIATIPISDTLFLFLPQILSQTKFLGIMPILEQNLPHYYNQSVGIPNVVGWEDNMIGLMAIVSGLLIMHIYRFKQASLLRQSTSTSTLPSQIPDDKRSWSNRNGFEPLNSSTSESMNSNDAHLVHSGRPHTCLEGNSAVGLNGAPERKNYVTLLESWVRSNKKESVFETTVDADRHENSSRHPILLRSQTLCDDYSSLIATKDPPSMSRNVALNHNRRHTHTGRPILLKGEEDDPAIADSSLLKLSGDV